MVWLKLPVLIAMITDGDGSTSHESKTLLVAIKTSANIPRCP